MRKCIHFYINLSQKFSRSIRLLGLSLNSNYRLCSWYRPSFAGWTQIRIHSTTSSPVFIHGTSTRPQNRVIFHFKSSAFFQHSKDYEKQRTERTLHHLPCFAIQKTVIGEEEDSPKGVYPAKSPRTKAMFINVFNSFRCERTKHSRALDSGVNKRQHVIH